MTYNHRVLSSNDAFWSWAAPDYAAGFWERTSFSGPVPGETLTSNFDARPSLNPDYDGAPVDVLTYGFQYEAGRYPSSFVVAEAIDTVRLAEKLRVPDPATLVVGGLAVTLVIAPHYADGEQDADHDILHIDADNRIYVRALDSAVVMRASGQEAATPPLQWTRDSELTFRFENGEERARLEIVGAELGEVFLENAPLVLAPDADAIYLLGDVNGSQEGADLRSVVIE